MRISISMLRRLSAGILVLAAVLLLFPAPASADTGTFKILDYVVTMEPQNDGRVLMTFEQQWQVLTGDAPWVTVGMPNNNFEIQSFSGDVAKAYNGSGNGFYGVRLDLSKDFKAGSTFNLKFSVLQNGLLERLADLGVWRIAYTPGWYDNIPIVHLQVNLISPVDYSTYTSVSPMPAVTGKTFTWEQNNIPAGGRVTVLTESTDGSFLTALPPSTTAVQTTSKSGGFAGLSSSFWIFVIILVVVGLLIVFGIRQSKKKQEEYIRRKATSIQEEMDKDPTKKQAIEEDFKDYVDKKNLQPDAQGRFYDPSFGSYVTPAIWWAILANQASRNANVPPAGGCVHTTPPSCVHSCACVSCACACACACAGGGAAGCSRKTLHDFRQSQVKNGEKGEVSTIK